MKFAKNVASQAKKLNIAIQSQYHEQVQPFFISFPHFKSSSGNRQFFYTPSIASFFSANFLDAVLARRICTGSILFIFSL
jgi:hypothetical protein